MIMNRLHLAPDGQLERRFLWRADSGREPFHENLLQPIAAEMDWGRQRDLWRNALQTVANTGCATRNVISSPHHSRCVTKNR